MTLTLFIPGLLRHARSPSAPAMPALARLVQQAALAEVAREGALAWLAPRFGVAKQQDWPIAALSVASSGADPDDGYWLRATPVALEAGRDDVHVVGPVLDLSSEETAGFLQVLQRHFAADGLAFAAPTPADWCVALQATPTLVTQSLRVAIGDRLRPHLPTGASAPLWLRWSQEIEMLLHEHPLNVARVTQDRAAVSAIWLQHGGRMPPAAASRPDVALWGDADPDLRALAAHAATVPRPLPDDLAPVLHRATATQHVVALPEEADPAAVDARFAAPAWDALRTGSVASVEIIVDAPGMPAVLWHAQRPGWRQRILAPKTRPFAAQVERALQDHIDGNRPA